MTMESTLITRHTGRRGFIRAVGTALCIAPAMLALRNVAHASDLQLLEENDPAAKALHYVADVKKSAADPSHDCASCALYAGAAGSANGLCKLFPKNLVKAGASCNAWAPQM